MSCINHAKRELALIGYNVNPDPNSEDVNDFAVLSILELIDTFRRQGHSGFSANYVLNIFNKCFKEKMIKKFGDSAMYFDGAFACNEVLINKKMMNFKYDDNKRKQIITCKKDLTNKKKINQLVTTSLVNTFKKKIENSKNDTSSFSNKKYDKVRNDFEEIYLTTVEDKVRIDFKKDNSEILRLSSPKIKNESDTIINLLKDDDSKNIK